MPDGWLGPVPDEANDRGFSSLKGMLTKAEGQSVLKQMEGIPRLVAILLYGSGLRLLECLTLRVKDRSEEHTSELQSRLHLVCRLLLEKKKKKNKQTRPG